MAETSAQIIYACHLHAASAIGARLMDYGPAYLFLFCLGFWATKFETFNVTTFLLELAARNGLDSTE